MCHYHVHCAYESDMIMNCNMNLLYTVILQKHMNLLYTSVPTPKKISFLQMYSPKNINLVYISILQKNINLFYISILQNRRIFCK